MRPEEIITELDLALSEYRFTDVNPIIEAIVPTDFDKKKTKSVLSLLRKKRLFPELEKAAGIFHMGGTQDPVVRRQWAQALLDQNRVPQALAALKVMRSNIEENPEESMEVQGLIGRAYKQLYVNSGGTDNLIQAIKGYHPGWISRQHGDYRWHGINLVALLTRAQRDGIVSPIHLQIGSIAKEILSDIKNLDDDAGMWDYGTAMEACIGLGKHEDAFTWAKKYIQHPAVDAFELGSTLRQLKEVWLLEGTEIGDKLLPVLEYELMQREGGSLELTTMEVKDTNGFEAIYGDDAYTNLEWMETMFQRSKSIGKVYETSTGKRYGTGFIIKGSDLHQEWGDAPVFITNAHVISDNPFDEAPLSPGDASVEFTRLSPRPRVELGGKLFISPRLELDVCVSRIDAPECLETLTPSYQERDIPEVSDKPRIYVMGHPGGREMAVSIYDNILVAYSGPFIHYRSPTEKGSSGSPVFTYRWKLIAIHHEKKDELQVNEGVMFGPIKSAIT